LLTVQPRLYEDSLHELLDDVHRVNVVARVSDPFKVLSTIGKTGANVVIHSWPDLDEVPRFYALWMEQYPDLQVISISSNSLRVFGDVVTSAGSELSSLLSILRQLLLDRQELERSGDAAKSVEGATGLPPVTGVRQPHRLDLPQHRLERFGR
jgi:hypothetical protein